MSVMQGAPKNKLIFPLCCLHTNVGLATCVSIHNKNHLLSATSQSGQGSFWPSHYTLTPNNPQLMKEWKQLLHTIIYWRLLTVRANMISLKFLFPTILFLIALTESLGLGIQRHICITWSVRLFVHLDIWTSQNLFFFFSEDKRRRSINEGSSRFHLWLMGVTTKTVHLATTNCIWGMQGHSS